MKVLGRLLATLQIAIAIKNYPVTLGGFQGHTELEDFLIDSSGNLAVAAYSSDLSWVSSSETNIVLYR